MRRSLVALAVVLLAVSDAPAPPPVFRPAPPPPRPTPVPRPPTTPSPVRPPIYRPPTYRPPVIILPTPNFHREFDDARRRSAAEAAELLRKQKALAAAERAALLNRLALEELLRKQGNLADLRRLRAEWLAVGPGAGLDPLLAMRLEAAERAAEAALFGELFDHLAAGRYARALDVIDALGEPRFAPAAAVLELPVLRPEVAHAAALARVRAALARAKAEPGFAEAVFQLPRGRGPDLAPLVRQDAALTRAGAALDGHFDDPRAGATAALAELEQQCGAALASEVRAEFAARFALEGEFATAEHLLRGATDTAHARRVLEDLRAATLSTGALALPQVAARVPGGANPPALARAILPNDQLDKWKPLARPRGESTVTAERARVRAKAGALTDAEFKSAAARVNPIAERLRAALGAAAAPLNEFAAKVEAARGKPFVTETERFLAAACGTHGYTVAEAVGALAGEAHRPAGAAGLLAALADPTDFGAFAVRVELAGRPPESFAPMPAAGFKLTGIRDRARLREAAIAEIESRAGEGAPLVAALAARLPVRAAPVTDAEAVRALLDAARDGADAHARLTEAETELRAIWSNIERGEYGDPDDELRALQRTVQFRRIETQALLKRRTTALVRACELLGGFGPAAAPAAEWLAEQPAGAPWGEPARAALRRARGE
jgi:hypothetical protein